MQHDPQPVLCIRAVSQRTLPVDRLDEAYAFEGAIGAGASMAEALDTLP